MQSAFIINDRTGKPYAVVGILAGGTEFYPIAESAVPWASWMTEDFAAKKITKQQLVVTLDNSMSVDGPMPANRANKPKLDELIKKAKKVPKGESDKEEMEQTEEKSLVPVISIMDARLDNLEDRDWRNTVNFKAKSFLADSNKSTFAYEVKRTRAVWDDALSIPGTNRRGGWRCPPGTRYGGQITDRFGRNCGWGVARRLANEISDLGERLENVGDRRRERRVNRRNERVARRLREGGRVERAARAVGNALESTTPGERQPGLLERAAGRVAEALDTPSTPTRPGRQRRGQNRRRPGLVERAAGRLAEVLDSDGTEERRPTPRRPRPQAPQARPARPRQPRRPRPEAPEARPARPRQPRRADNVSGTPVPAGAPRPNESLEQYKRRKYNEHQARVRKIRDEGGNAGFLRYDEWEQFHGPAVEDNWNKAQQRNRGRGARRAATDAGAARSASRRPTPADAPEPVQPARRQRRPFNAPGQRGLSNEAAARRRRAAMERDGETGELKIVKHNNKYYVVKKSEVDRANANGANLDVVNEPPRAPLRPRPQADMPEPQAPPSGSAPRGGGGGNKPKISDLIPVEPPHKSHKNDRLDNHAMGHKVIDGVLVPDPVSKGNKNINSVEDAVAFVANGGSLDDVPDEFVHAAIFDNGALPGQPMNGKRFRLEGDPGNGINNRGQSDPRQKTYLVKDSVTGRQYIMKSPSFVQDEAIGEQYAAILGQLAGRPMARVRVIGPRETRINRDRGVRRNPNNQILVEHFGGIVDGQIVPGTNTPARVDREARATVQFIDLVLGNGDRHPNNYLWVDGEQLPIDHGILPGGNGQIQEISPRNAQMLINNPGNAHIKRSFARITNENIDAIVEQQGKAWRAAGIPADRVNSNLSAMRTTLRNLAEAAKG